MALVFRQPQTNISMAWTRTALILQGSLWEEAARTDSQQLPFLSSSLRQGDS